MNMVEIHDYFSCYVHLRSVLILMSTQALVFSLRAALWNLYKKITGSTTLKFDVQHDQTWKCFGSLHKIGFWPETNQFSSTKLYKPPLQKPVRAQRNNLKRALSTSTADALALCFVLALRK